MKRILLLTATLLVIGLSSYVWVRSCRVKPEPPLLGDLRAGWYPATDEAAEPKTVAMWIMLDQPVKIQPHLWYQFTFSDGKIYLNASKVPGMTHAVKVTEGKLSEAEITALYYSGEMPIHKETP